MSLQITIIVAYFSVGLVALITLDLLTHRIRRRLPSAASEVQGKLVARHKESMAILCLAAWVFWPLVIYAALRGTTKGKEKI